MNDSKTQIIVFGPMSVLREINIKGVNFGSDTTIRFVSTVKNLGIHMDSGLTMSNHVVELKKKCFLTLRNLTKIRFLLTTKQLKGAGGGLFEISLEIDFMSVSNKGE